MYTTICRVKAFSESIFRFRSSIGATEKDGKLLTSGGRVLGAAAVAEDLPAAIGKAYALADRIHFDNAFCRRDIGRRAMKALEEKK